VSVHDRWQGARTGPGKRWEVRWRERDQQHKRRFATKADAEKFDAQRRLQPDVRRAAEGRALSVNQMMKTWLSTKRALKPKTVDAYRTDAREITTAFGDRLAADLRSSEIQEWSGRARGLSLRRRSLVALRQAFALAIKDGLLSQNPCTGVPLPRQPRGEPRFLSWSQLKTLAEASGDSAPLIWLLGTSGLRLGEAIGLQVGDIDVRRGRVRISRSVVVTSGGTVVGTPKSGQSRTVPVARYVLEQLPLSGRKPDEWLFLGPQGGRLDPHTWRRGAFARAAKVAGLDGLNPHELRHTAASLAIQQGADVLAVQRMLGHASAATTLGIYSHLFDAGLDVVADRMQKAAEQAGLDSQEGAKKAHQIPEGREKGAHHGLTQQS
jgi:integrase